MAFKKYARRVARKAGKAIKKRYFKGKGYSRPKIGKMVSDINYLKTVLNPEKKYKDTRTLTAWTNMYPNDPLQTNFDIAGITQGDLSTNRNGNSIKLSSIHLNIDVRQDISATQNNYYKIYVVKYRGIQDTSANVFTRFLSLNPITSLRDYHAPRNIEHMHDFTVIKTFRGFIKADDATGEQPMRPHELHMKFNKHARWDTSGTLQEGEIYIFGVSAFGADASDNGISFRMNARAYWYDN